MTLPADMGQVATVLGGYSSFDLVAALAALQLLPENASALGRLEAAVTLAAGVPVDSSAPHISAGKLRNTLNGPPFSAALQDEDSPFDELLTEPLAFHGGSYLVSPGLGRVEVYIVEHLLKAIFFTSPTFPDARFSSATKALCVAALRLSDHILREAGFERYAVGDSMLGAPIATGALHRLSTLKRLVEFSEHELDQLLRPRRAASLGPLIGELGQVEYPRDFEQGGPLQLHPVLRDGERLVVASPLSLLCAARQALLGLAVSRGCASELASRFLAAVADDVAASLAEMGMREQQPSLPATPALPLEELVFQLVPGPSAVRGSVKWGRIPGAAR
jgi:hypothetical protein